MFKLDLRPKKSLSEAIFTSKKEKKRITKDQQEKNDSVKNVKEKNVILTNSLNR